VPNGNRIHQIGGHKYALRSQLSDNKAIDVDDDNDNDNDIEFI
jgi:hypothetical protein